MTRTMRLFTGFLLGAILGLTVWAGFSDAPWLAPLVSDVMQPIGQIFLRMIFAAVVPLVFSSLVLGVFEMGDFSSLGRVAVKTGVYTVGVSTLSVLVGITLVSWLKPGANFDPALIASAKFNTLSSTVVENASHAKSLIQTIVELIPKNPIETATRAMNGEMLSLMVFSLIFGSALLSVKGGRTGDPLVRVIEGVRDVSMKMVDFAMAFAPIGIFALTFSLCSVFGWTLVLSLSKYVGVVLLGLLFQQFVVYGILLGVFARKSIWTFLRETKEVTLTAFATSSSNATLPISLRVAEHSLRLNQRVSRFVLTVGATANQNGTALFEGVTVLFLAQVFDVHLTLAQQLTVMAMSVIAGVGTAGVPGGSLPLIVVVLQSVGIPPEGIGIILGVDRFLDMCRTVLNVSGDLVLATIVNATEPDVVAQSG